MTTMTDSDPASSGRVPGVRPLRRSRGDRMISGVAGGLGEYFIVDAVIFRVLFAVLSFFGGVGLLLYGMAWLLIPEPQEADSALDRTIAQLRRRRVPPWLVIIGGAIVLWIAWFSWWAPGPTFPALMLIAILTLVLLNRLGRGTPPIPMGSGSVDSGAAPESGAASESGAVPESGAAPLGPTGAVQPPPAWTPPQATTDTTEYVPATSAPPVGPPLIPPLSDTRQSMQAWLAETKVAHAERIRRRRPIKVGVALALAMAWALVAMLDAFTRVPFPAYLWTGLAVLGAGLLLSLVTRRITLLLLLPIAMLAALALVFGGTRASLSDGSGQIGWLPTSVSQLGDHRQFAGQSTLDLTKLNVGSTGSERTAAPVAVHLTQAAGEVRVVLPVKLNATVIADVHMGEIQNGTSHSIGDYVSGANVHLELPAATAVTGQPITIYVDLTAGHVQVDRIS
ncbi:PspC domain-containing protein [Jatrophihabitans lederbergiae]|uniref:PspC domain-containing protein n=1 Tax=Jatrophihabitans lederbergiae TaxID=3075547 RepID=A0ABU2J5G9_9ACTN|nr:PspC domain-containing protein [Jatrophihabitans sp. DSM 44399]MDT0260235.1 PspC domain-containing protein [Jatrophihabitans sp. DSM 44399]